MSPNTTRLQGRTALVTGSTGGLGVAIAKALAAQGALVVVSGRNKERGDAVVAEIRAAAGQAEFVAADLGAGGAEVHRLAQQATEVAGGPLDILVNNAGVWGMPEPTGDVSEQALLESYQTNVIAPFLLTGAVVPAMAERGHGAVVNVGSITGLIGGDKSALYSSTKAAVHSLTKSWAAEYGPRGVRVNAVAPGPIATERAADVADEIAPVLARIPSRRMSTPEEVAAAVTFLAGDDAGNIHGAILSVDGGWAAT
ncbi:MULTISPECIES: SDR family NAD(P)-dependent oxidoreductase [unclassified Mycolicibacterium]|uniref:SDR family NAD(P)-dependent oxidoreductase n=1 Tax=unclassified Mycolicibacterium TaxID=2636767 RepID=UPI0012DD94A1|nr:MULTISPECIES: glucose 1-dehydrogenase [unclassified Mycolicibacterium]MUL85090.1 glucose 1-dehydrogenase [Mycolicibacterium sp. CBMA 329]MUL91057.1 glucose 1-dehydrogenase [Mycolicibacterium sp. CBMA 331]MUL98272.1 glucose 1-dehydrogenase [Mycolicibacterium sp. CBMA 334]MUM26148.1 glucose 1-dehydrogenase [Mycolicibacterium sp. CBMA 295]MUM40816.1 glucose 1-dehydrogenase [Mycolicibacterium sp. CBMA 247]